MKRVVTIGVILAALIGFALWGIYSISGVTQKTGDSLQLVEEEIERGDYKQAAALTLTIREDWKDAENVFGIYLKHEPADQVGKSLARLSVCLAEEDRLETLMTISEVRYDLRRIYENELPLFKNIF